MALSDWNLEANEEAGYARSLEKEMTMDEQLAHCQFCSHEKRDVAWCYIHHALDISCRYLEYFTRILGGK